MQRMENITPPKLTLFFSGSDMTWEDTALFLNLGATKRHNLREKSATHYYYFFDGPGASSSPEHPAVKDLQFDESSPDFVKEEKSLENNYLFSNQFFDLTRGKHIYNLARGKGMDHIIRAAYEIIKMQLMKGTTEFDFIGFSRGGSIALAEGALIKKLESDHFPKELLNKVKVNIIAIDPVAGLSRNKSASLYGELSPLVKTCIVGLATNESLPGFAPRDILSNIDAHNVKFHILNQYVFLPFPEDHLMCHLWMQDIVKRYIPSHSDLLLPCNETLLIERRLGLTALKWHDKLGETAAYRMVHYVQDKQKKEKHIPKYPRNIFPADEKQGIKLQHGIEEFFKHIHTQRAKLNVGHTSLQNDADCEIENRTYTKSNGEVIKISKEQPIVKKVQQISAQFYERTVKAKLSLYTNTLFVNLLHEAMFQKVYPHLHNLFLNWDIKDLNAALKEFDGIQLPYTQSYVKNSILSGAKLEAIEKMQSTNIKQLGDIFNYATNHTHLETKKDDKESKLIQKEVSDLELYCFANILVKSSQKVEESLFDTHKQRYSTHPEFRKVLIEVYTNKDKPLPNWFKPQNIISKFQIS